MNKHYAITDLHGMYSLWEQIKTYCDKTDQIICLGDVLDRGTKGLNILWDMMNDSRIILLKGDHESMLETIGRDALNKNCDTEMLDEYFTNGGAVTFVDFVHCSSSIQQRFIDFINELPIATFYVNTHGQRIYLCHAGFTPFNLKTIKPYEIEDLLMWDRNHIKDEWPEGCDNLYVVHGHTPTGIILNRNCTEPQDIICYAEGHKVDIDLGTADTNQVALFDLDEFCKEKIFYGNSI